jgi:hypothetical protein
LVQGRELCPQEEYAYDANWDDDENPPPVLNTEEISDWKKRDCLARIVIFQTQDKERQKGDNNPS